MAIKVVSKADVPPLGSPLTPRVPLPTLRVMGPQKGRPLNKDRGKSYEATKPWVLEGVSRRTWYRRKKVSRETLVNKDET